MEKRYKQTNPWYVQWHDWTIKFQMESMILNLGREEIPHEHSIILDYPNVALELLRRIGDQKGQYMRGGGWLVADIPFFESKLSDIERNWELYRKQRIKMGYKEPEEYPQHILEPKLKIEAKIDVLNRECEVLTKKLSELKEKEEAKTDGQVLEYGLLGNGKFWGSRAATEELATTLRIIDGQHVGTTIDGLLIINDTRSPYNGMSVVDYRVLCTLWQNEQKAKAKEKLKALQMAAKESGEQIPHMLPARTPYLIKKENLPKWPEGVRNWLTEPEDESSSFAPKRTK